MKKSTHYKGRPVGDCLEEFFKDFRCNFDEHITLTFQLPRQDPRRFSKGMPKLIESAVCRLWDPETGVAPSSKRTAQDIPRLMENFLLVVQADGAVVPGIYMTVTVTGILVW